MAASSATERASVVLVNEDGDVVGECPKLAAHEAPGRLHLAFSVFLYDAAGRVLLQRRAASKYHFPLVWANSCCSHPLPGEDPMTSATNRVAEELGLTCTLVAAGHFTYRASCPASGLVEHEYDLVFTGQLDGVPEPVADEVSEVRLLRPEQVSAKRLGGALAPWLEPALQLAEQSRI